MTHPDSPFPAADSITNTERELGAVFAPKFDASGLVTAVTVDAATGQVLMVAHMNAQALEATVRTGLAHYWSRSRSALWKKGESSGELQEVVEIRTDCDQDAVIVMVNQTGRGAACHTGRRTCFFRRVVTGSDGAISLEDAGEPTLFDPEAVYGS
ncbi:phosphoribosyl-AMP cyclohydrolase [Pelagibacterium montanilacus]|uniref:phosphoribosyl-AMP cyclohydrolase n=1 Tax=Pelagibacterium montanilacus TaxID=2185280 RepID=UPI000F8DD84B|nr:phosphoribosyl-AMP cyclohydrolase [Pelagibacterium montanilacus]